MSLKALKASNYVTFYDIEPNGTPVEIVNTKFEKLKNFQTKLEEDFLVLEFREKKPLVCKNPVLDALGDAFPEIGPDNIRDLIGKKIMLIQSVENIAGETKELVRVDALGTARLAGMAAASQPHPGATVSDNPPTNLNEPAHMQADPPPPSQADMDAAFPGTDNSEPPF